MDEETLIRIAAIEHALADKAEDCAVRYEAVTRVMDICYAPPSIEQGYKDAYSAAREDRFVYLLAKHGTTDSYLGFGSHWAGEANEMHIVRCWGDHARWQAMRLASGLALMCPLAGFATLEEAREHAMTYPVPGVAR